MAPAKLLKWDPCPLGLPEILTAAHVRHPFIIKAIPGDVLFHNMLVHHWTKPLPNSSSKVPGTRDDVSMRYRVGVPRRRIHNNT